MRILRGSLLSIFRLLYHIIRSFGLCLLWGKRKLLFAALLIASLPFWLVLLNPPKDLPFLWRSKGLPLKVVRGSRILLGKSLSFEIPLSEVFFSSLSLQSHVSFVSCLFFYFYFYFCFSFVLFCCFAFYFIERKWLENWLYSSQ